MHFPLHVSHLQFALSTALGQLPDRQDQRSVYKIVFMITAKIHARSLVNFYCQYADKHMNLKFMRHISKREREVDNLLS